MEKNQFDILMLAITGLDTKLNGKIDGLGARMDRMESELSSFRAEVKQEFARVHKDLNLIADQVGKTTHDVSVLKSSAGKIPSA